MNCCTEILYLDPSPDYLHRQNRESNNKFNNPTTTMNIIDSNDEDDENNMSIHSYQSIK